MKRRSMLSFQRQRQTQAPEKLKPPHAVSACFPAVPSR